MNAATLDNGFYAFAPVTRNEFAVELDFVPVEAEEWDFEMPGSGRLRVTDGSIEVLRYNPSPERPNFTIAYEDILEAFAYLNDPNY